jgi:hypothetical protein
MHITKEKKPIWKGYMYMIPTTLHPSQDKILEILKRSMSLGIKGREGWVGGAHRISWGLKL